MEALLHIGANGIVTNQFGQVLVIKRDDSRTWAIPGGSLDAGELPDVASAREVEEETGLKVLPVRLVGLYHWPFNGVGHLTFSFRCLIRGGELTTSAESPQVGFVAADSLPRTMFALHRQRIEQAIGHHGGPPYWGRQKPSLGLVFFARVVGHLVYRWKDWQRRRNNQPRYRPPKRWGTGAFVAIGDESGQVLWVRRTDYDVWNLPGGKAEPGEAPWETAVRETREETGLDVRLTDLSGVYVKPEQNQMIFTFTAEVEGGQLTPNAEARDFAYFRSGGEPANSLPKQLPRAADAFDPRRDKTRFRLQAGPPGLEVLGLK